MHHFMQGYSALKKVRGKGVFFVPEFSMRRGAFVVAVTVLPYLVLVPAFVSAQDYDIGQQAFINGDYTTAFKEWLPLALQGNASAQSGVGALYDAGKGAPQDDAEALRWYQLAAEQGDSAAQLGLGRLYEQGRGVPQNDAEAVRWYRLAAEQGHPIAQMILQEKGLW